MFPVPLDELGFAGKIKAHVSGCSVCLWVGSSLPRSHGWARNTWGSVDSTWRAVLVFWL